MPSTDTTAVASGPKKTLGVTGVTINAMALIAPGAFLWITFQLQAAQTGPDGSTTAFDMWQGIVFALILAFLTAISYSQMATIYPEAGYGSSYYFAEKTFMDKSEHRHYRWARLAKLVTGWAAHLFYWVYPGVMVTFFAIVVSYVAGLFGATDGSGNPGLPVYVNVVIAVVFAVVVGMIAVRGISGSTLTSLIINIIQLTTLVFFSVLAIIYRVTNPDHADFVNFAGKDAAGKVTSTQIGHPDVGSILLPHSFGSVLFQSTIAILILVGFESCTALGADAKDPKRSVPRGVLLSLIIQGLFAYLIEYFAANLALSDKLTNTDATGAPVAGISAAAASQAPIGDLMRLFGDSLLGGIGFGLDVTMAVTVLLAILGTTLACINTGVRVSYAMAKDKEMPEIMGLMHGRFATPSAGVWILVAVSAIIGGIGAINTVIQTGIGIASNLGTFILYALICVFTLVAFAGRKEHNVFLHIVIPVVGLLANILMIGTIFYLAFVAGGNSSTEGFIAIGFAAVWGLLSIVYILLNNRNSGRGLLHPEGFKETVSSGV